ncbi:MAG: hypothetical protein ACXVQV_04285 [Actinomycetota bacterium]
MRVIPREVRDSAFVRDTTDAYALGLWCADSYWWSSSIGLSNVEPELVIRFGRYLGSILSPERVRVRVYQVEGQAPDERVLDLARSRISIRPSFKMKRTAYHVYVNSRPLVRSFFDARRSVADMPEPMVAPYLAGRFDGDGAFGTPRVPGIRIAYTTHEEASVDQLLLSRIGVEKTSLLHYARVNEWCVYIKKPDVSLFEERIERYSWKASCREPCRD